MVAADAATCTSAGSHRVEPRWCSASAMPTPTCCSSARAPGFHEDKQGEPFVGAAGQLLTRMLAGIGLRREDVYIANVIKCRPPGNRDPQPDEIEACTPWLIEQISHIQPSVIVTLGQLRDEVRAEHLDGHHPPPRTDPRLAWSHSDPHVPSGRDPAWGRREVEPVRTVAAGSRAGPESLGGCARGPRAGARWPMMCRLGP